MRVLGACLVMLEQQVKRGRKAKLPAHPAMDVWGGALQRARASTNPVRPALAKAQHRDDRQDRDFPGTTTEYMAKAGSPVFSCELRLRYFHYSALRLANIPNIRLERR
jgi:hypothetical protein